MKTTGDGVLAEFASAVNAVRCALGIQRAMPTHNADLPPDKRIEFRIGINVGDIIVEGDDIFGDGVNVAARLESISDPGGICISDVVHQQVNGRLDADFVDQGEQSLKNIVRPVRVYRLKLTSEGRVRAAASNPCAARQAFHRCPRLHQHERRPRAGIFFRRHQRGHHHRSLRLSQLQVIARNSTFTYKGKPVDVKQVGRELGVRYVLEGSVRKAGNRVRVTGQLIDTLSGAHVWADNFDRDLTDIFAVQDELTREIVSALKIKLRESEKVLLATGGTKNVHAHDSFLKGRELMFGNK